jgi:hypothetical protein
MVLVEVNTSQQQNPILGENLGSALIPRTPLKILSQGNRLTIHALEADAVTPLRLPVLQVCFP